jgi:glycosyltransferase involved in cell wall biosynthesis
MKPELLFYSDYLYFAGCENMIANFLNDHAIMSGFSVSFVYHNSWKYEEGLNSRAPNSSYKRLPLNLTNSVSYRKPDYQSAFFLFLHKVMFAIYIPLNKYYSILINTLTLYKVFKKQKIDILHINNGGFPGAFSCYSAVFAGRLSGIKHIIYVVNNLAQSYAHPFRWLDYPLDYLTCKSVSVFITASRNAGERLKKVLKLEDSKHLTINNGIRRRTITLTTNEFRDKYFVPGNKLLASVVANLEVRKGHIYLLKAILNIKENFPEKLNTFFIIEGTGPEKEILQKFINYNNLSEYVQMIDFIPDIFNLLNASDFIILPSAANEDFPNVVIEAMSLGKPVIGTETGGIPEQISDNETGLVVKPKDPVELSNAIIRLNSEPELIKRFSIEAKNRFDTLYEASISTGKYFDLYRSFI